MMNYEIRPARPVDLPYLGPIELAAAQLLAGHAPASVLNETTNEAELLEAQRQGLLWVAVADNVPVGFAHLKFLEPGTVHLAEIDVQPDHGRRGIGTQLLRAVCDWSATNSCRYVTLTTFREVRWNMPFYARFGFEAIPSAGLTPALLSIIVDEARRGLDTDRRVAMRFDLSRT